ncbi:hypothetical protein CMUS01_08335 [Colletotrichum musicola]|uniref:Cell wall galactomannoprotein n=1 Tax=Colletotrichum musicola TaxID=2175873 RepID=A0A8H6NDX7_9PEZI|nr:hypothetical protein CMUS01_08335 [Colletotrichum musicola]
MRFSTVLASVTVLAAASARTLPPFEAIGLPQMATNVSHVVDDMNALDKVLGNLTTAIQIPPASGVLGAVNYIGAALSNLISLQMAVHQTYLNAQELPLSQIFPPESSTAILGLLNDRIYPQTQTALDLLKGVKAKNYIGQMTTDRAILGYLGSIKSEFSKFSDMLVGHIDTNSQGAVRGVLDNIIKLLNDTVTAFTSS